MKNNLYLITALLVLAALMCCPMVGATPYRDYTMKYAEITPDVNVVGYLYIQALCFDSTYSNTVILQRVDTAGAPAVTTGIVSVDTYNLYTPLGENETLRLSPTAAYDEALVPGTYSLKLTDGNNEVPEYAVVTIVAGQKTEIHFQGHASSRTDTVPTPVCDGKITIIDAQYGNDSGNCHQIIITDKAAWDETITDTEAWDETIVDSQAYDETVIDTAAYDETIHHNAVYTTVHHNAVTHVIHHPAISEVPAYYTVSYTGYHNGNCKIAQNGQAYDFIVCGVKYKIVGNGDYQYTYHPVVPGTSAYDETVIDQAAWDEQVLVTAAFDETIHHNAITHIVHHDTITHIVHHDAATHIIHHEAATHTETLCNPGTWTTVTSQVQSTIDAGHTSFIFDSRPNPGGIWSADMSTLVVPISDPLPNVKKQIKISYSACDGEPQTITADEYSTITL
jgi:hypothetical protein